MKLLSFFWSSGLVTAAAAVFVLGVVVVASVVFVVLAVAVVLAALVFVLVVVSEESEGSAAWVGGEGRQAQAPLIPVWGRWSRMGRQSGWGGRALAQRPVPLSSSIAQHSSSPRCRDCRSSSFP